MIKGPVTLVPGEGCLPGLQMAAFLLCPHVAERQISFSSSYEAHHESSTLRTSSNPNSSPKSLSSNTISLGSWGFNLRI